MGTTNKLTSPSQTETVYVPALRWKQGEIDALAGLADGGLLGGVKPMLLIDTQKEREQNVRVVVPREPGPYIDYVASEVQKLLRDRLEAYIDTRLFDYGNDDYDGMSRFFSTMHANNMRAIPVLRRNEGISRLKNLRGCAKNSGVCIRLRVDTLHDADDIEELLRSLGIDDRQTDLIFDLFRLPSPSLNAEESAQRISVVLRSGSWRRATLIGGSFVRPDRQTEHFPARIERCEVREHEKIAARLSGHRLIFGDYGIVLPESHPANQKGGIGQHPIIRYCAAYSWYVWFKNDALATYRELSHECATYSEFMGRTFSPGDAYIEGVARATELQLGNPAKWVEVDTSHHVMYAKRQVEGTLPSPEPIDRSECRFPEDLA